MKEEEKENNSFFRFFFRKFKAFGGIYMNSVAIIGNMGKEPELRYTQGGSAICDISLAVNEITKNGDGEKKEKVSWFSVRVLGRTAEAVANYTKKGSKVGIIGKLTQDSWEKDGKKHSIIRIIAREVDFLSPRQAGDSEDFKYNPEDASQEGYPF